MALLLLQFAVLAAIIIVAGSYLAKYADTIGELTPLGRTLAGLVLLATATSLPELAVDCSAVLIDAPDLAVGDLFGSSLMNLMILALLDLAFFTRGRMLSKMAAAHALSAMMSLVLTGLALLFILAQFDVPWRIGPGTLVIAVTYFCLLRLIYFDQRIAVALEAEMRPEETNVAETEISMTLRHAIIGYVISTAVVFVVAPLLAGTADELAKVSGLGQTFVGTTLVAVCTSLPEVVTTSAALRMGNVDMAVGNIFGSNSFNMTILFGADLFYDKPLLSSIAPAHAITAACVIIITGVATVGLLYRAEKRYWLVEPDALLVLLLVIGALGLVYHFG